MSECVRKCGSESAVSLGTRQQVWVGEGCISWNASANVARRGLCLLECVSKCGSESAVWLGMRQQVWLGEGCVAWNASASVARRGLSLELRQ